MTNPTKEEEIKSSSFLSPKRETLQVKGKLFYNEGAQAWSIIRLKKELIHEFPQLKEKRSNFNYLMILHRNHKEIKKAISELETNKEVIPILLLFSKEKNSQ